MKLGIAASLPKHLPHVLYRHREDTPYTHIKTANVFHPLPYGQHCARCIISFNLHKEPGILVQLTMLAQAPPFRMVEPEFESRFKGPLSEAPSYPSGFPSGVGLCTIFLEISLWPVGGCLTWAWSQQWALEIHDPRSSLWPELMRAGAQIPRLPGPSGELAVFTWPWAPVAHSGIWLNKAPAICYLLSLGSFPHPCWYFSDITLQIKLLALKSLTRCLLLGKLKFDTRTQILNHSTQAVEGNPLPSPPANSKECAEGWKLWNQDFSLNTSLWNALNLKEQEQPSISGGLRCSRPEKHQRNCNGRVITLTDITFLKSKGEGCCSPVSVQPCL